MKKGFASGFTLVEAVIFLLVVCGLAGFLVPLSLNKTSVARSLAIQTMSMALNSRVMLAKIEYRLAGSKTTTIKIGGRTVNVAQGSGLPLGTADGIGAAMDKIRIGGLTPTYGSTTTYAFSASQTNCNVAYDSATGIVTAVTTGC